MLVTNGGKQAVYEAFATLLDPGDEVLVRRAVLDHLPRGDQARRRRPGRRRHRRDHRLPRLGRAARGGPHRAHQGAAVRLAVEPDRRGLPARAGRGDRPLGRRARPVGGHRRDLRAPRVRRREVHLDRHGRARAGRPRRRPQRRRQDLRDDRLAGRLADRPEGRGEGRHEPAVARHLERLQRGAGRGARRGLRRPVRGGRDARRRSTGAARRWCACSTRSPAWSAPSRWARSTPTRRSRTSSARSCAAGARRPPPSWPS